MARDKRTINRFNEEILLPTMLMFMSFSVLSAIYVVNELFVDELKFKYYYSYGNSIKAYKSQLLYLLVGLLTILSVQAYALKLKQRWLYLLGIIGNSIFIYVFFQVINNR